VVALAVNLTANQLISYSKDSSMKLWPFSATSFPSKSPIETLFDHETRVKSSDTFDWLVATFDIGGKATVRDLRKAQDCVTTLQLSDVGKTPQICVCDPSILALSAGSCVELYTMDGTFVNSIDLQATIVFMAVHGPFVACSKRC
jgi:hypothetical protein